MAPRPPWGCRVRALPAPPLLLSLLLLLLLQPATPGVTCPPPKSVEHADIRVRSYSPKSRERYTCNSGFKRKAGTSSLTECVLNETTNIAHWTIPNLKCIKPAFTSKSDTTVATKSTMVPGSRLTPSKPPAAGTTGPISQEPSQAPPQTTAKALEHTPSASPETPGTYSYHSEAMTAVMGSVLPVVCVVLVGILVWYRKSRHTAQTPGVEMESMEEMPMNRGTSGRAEDAENYPHDLGHSRERLRAAEARAKAPTLP
ncbi:interleukin-15 receptor subunit alpha isoform X2 [Mustela nigripes]|uniref:interleukin-15 receptor subunit alpha isoform X2 n=1 Tax=Mustela nigripes TaxID=77151 RepID=UPI0028151A5E|nr:interleukin-15 receptor subunit alpha isoform X2 [Mustela nigripes]